MVLPAINHDLFGVTPEMLLFLFNVTKNHLS